MITVQHKALALLFCGLAVLIATLFVALTPNKAQGEMLAEIFDGTWQLQEFPDSHVNQNVAHVMDNGQVTTIVVSQDPDNDWRISIIVKRWCRRGEEVSFYQFGQTSGIKVGCDGQVSKTHELAELAKQTNLAEAPLFVKDALGYKD